jgi:hypothetical protein
MMYFGSATATAGELFCSGDDIDEDVIVDDRDGVDVAIDCARACLALTALTPI